MGRRTVITLQSNVGGIDRTIEPPLIQPLLPRMIVSRLIGSIWTDTIDKGKFNSIFLVEMTKRPFWSIIVMYLDILS